MSAVTRSGKHGAAGQYLGYALQPVRLCYHLLSAPDRALMSLEHLDDVAVHLADGRLELEQCKSVISRGNPLSDWSVDLWKTLAIWAEKAEAGEVDPAAAVFRYYVTPPKSGDFAAALDGAASEEDALKFLEVVRNRRAKLRSEPACEHYLKRFLDCDEAVARLIVRNAKVASADADPVDPIRDIYRRFVSPEILDLVCIRAVGAAKVGIDKLIRAGRPAILDADEFSAQQRAFVQKTNLPGLLTSFAERPSDEDIRDVLRGRPPFVRQLELIELEDMGCLRAVSDYLRTSADVSIWGERGLMFEKNLDDWNDDLLGRFGHIAAEVKDLLSDRPASVRGRTVYRRCAQLQAPLDGRAVPGHFVHGSLNALADDLRLGWHPDFMELMLPEEVG